MEHERLEVYQLTRELIRELQPILLRVPRGFAKQVDQIRRSTASIALNIAEGAAEFAPAEKARFYRFAKRSAGEASSTLDVLVDYKALLEADIAGPKGKLNRIIAMLIALIKSVAGPGGNPGGGSMEMDNFGTNRRKKTRSRLRKTHP